MSSIKSINFCAVITRKLTRDRMFLFKKWGDFSLKKVAWCLSLFVLLFASAPGKSGAVLISTLEVTSPISMVFAFNIDQTTFEFSWPGEVTANLTSVGDGNETADFIGFPVGNIALIERGSTAFSEKVSKAFNAGASAAIIYDNQYIPIHSGSYGGGNPSIPSVMTTRIVGLVLLDLESHGSTTVHLLVQDVASVPEPTTMLLLGFGLVGLAAVRRRIRR